MFAEVAVPVYVKQTFTYRLPGDMALRARAGSRVQVPFGKKYLTAFIVDLHETLAGKVDESAIKDVEELIDESPVITPEILELTKWVADYYFAPWGECLRAALPAGAISISEQMLELTSAGRAALAQAHLSPPKHQALERLLSSSGEMPARQFERGLSKPRAGALIRQLSHDGLIRVSQRIAQSRMKAKLHNVVRLSGQGMDDGGAGMRGGVDGDELTHPGAGPQPPTPNSKRKPLNEKQLRVVEALRAAPDAIPFSELLDAADVSSSVVRTLEKRGIVEVFARQVRRDPLAHIEGQPAESVTLNAEQQDALDRIVERIDEHQYSTFLLHGVTASGKTEIYIRAMREAISRGMSALMLVPEISLTPIFSRRLRAQFGEAVAILHSSLSEGERTDEWRRIKEGDARVVIGTRSAVFAPLDKLGLVIVDEEHDGSYKQDEAPRYNGRDTAIMRASRADAVVVLGSATPSLESYHNAQSGKYTYLRLHTRYGDRALAQVQTIDMREVFERHGKAQTLSDELKSAIEATFARREQSMILLNRRGFSSFLLCRSCGLAIHCPNCDVTLTYHRYNSSLQCHYCNFVRPVPRVCDACEGEYIHYVGLGTEQLEARLKEMFPEMNIARLDRDTTRTRGSFEQIIMEFAGGGIDLLVGTQMIAKGHDFPGVTLVGVVSVDVGLALPDFRAAERTFQLLTQVAGRAGRGDRPGRVIIQTYHPEHYSLVCAKTQDYEEFYRREIVFRRTMHYPPFSALINVLVHDKDFDRANNTATDFARELRDAAKGSNLRVLGPAPAAISRIREEYRFQILIKSQSRARAREALDIAMDRVTSAGRNPRSISVEVDPMNLM
ncbi:MAG TPA: primosomal protein N' [Blastocatellia bacterium]|nr:primosomal protein N' [Blastocatellia bacterium]